MAPVTDNNQNNVIVEENEESLPKRLRSRRISKPKEEIKITTPTKPKNERCNTCKQYSDNVLFYNGHPNESVEELIALTNDKLKLFNGDEDIIHEQDEFATNKVTYFCVYDKNGHLCPFDENLIEENKKLYFSGYLKPIYEDDTSPENGIPVKDVGPILAWYISGFDGGEKANVSFTTMYGEYYLMDPHPDYLPLMKHTFIKIKLTKTVIQFLSEEAWQDPSYEDLLQKITESDELDEESLIQHAQFVCDQVISFDSSSEPDEKPLVATLCMRDLMKRSGVVFKKHQRKFTVAMKGLQKRETRNWSKATTTALVRDVFENFFIDQIAKDDKAMDKKPKKRRCGVCAICQKPDCGNCFHCKDMIKFGGTGRSKQACKLRQCPNMAIQEAEESDDETDTMSEGSVETESTIPCAKNIIHKVEWIGEKFQHRSKTYYNEAKVGEIVVRKGDFVMLHSTKPNHPLNIAQIIYMWDEFPQGATFHANVFCRGSDTILGETSDPREIFVVDACENCPLVSVVRKAKVTKLQISNDWSLEGGQPLQQSQFNDDDGGDSFYYTKKYFSEFGRFEYVSENDPLKNDCKGYSFCISCVRRQELTQTNKPMYTTDCVQWRDETYKIGSCVYLEPDTYKFERPQTPAQEAKIDGVQNELYPEYYRKTFDNIKGSNADTTPPFCIGLIEDIMNDIELKIQVRKFYRPENTRNGVTMTYRSDLNLLYWSQELLDIPFSKVVGKCYIVYGDGLDIPINEWTESGPHRFYFNQCYNIRNHLFEDVNTDAKRIGLPKKGKGKGKRKSTTDTDLPPPWPKPLKPLKCMDVFAGCGGLSEGLHQTGLTITKWAIEKETAAAQAFKQNNLETKVFTADCNNLLKHVIEGTGMSKEMPKKGEVEMMVGGPPCQGFSGMNRFNAGQYSLFKNSLIASYLSYCDYYRPKYFVLENVRNFVTFKKNMVLKLTLRCLLAMGYQVTFGIIQAGQYGVPQTRRRLILIAAAPGYCLPNFPEPSNVFNKRGCQLTIQMGKHRYSNGTKWTESAPLRTITVKDAMFDLPKIENGHNKKEIPYDHEPESHFQRLMRNKCETNVLRDHICKEMAPIVEARMQYIPLYPGSDWRDLPNIVIRLRDGTYTNKLRYAYWTKKQTRAEAAKGVCTCVTGKGCESSDRQYNTLIPWCLPHTADRHNNWSGLYGRLEWDGFFSTTITNPEPMGKQGRVLHPEQHRVVSVRECARSQGFPDRYQFCGTILDKHRQIGNAVPPPLGAALGREIAKAYNQSTHAIQCESSTSY